MDRSKLTVTINRTAQVLGDGGTRHVAVQLYQPLHRFLRITANAQDTIAFPRILLLMPTILTFARMFLLMPRILAFPRILLLMPRILAFPIILLLIPRILAFPRMFLLMSRILAFPRILLLIPIIFLLNAQDALSLHALSLIVYNMYMYMNKNTCRKVTLGLSSLEKKGWETHVLLLPKGRTDEA